MAYDAPFYTAYALYLEEPLVRIRHDQMLEIFNSVAMPRQVIDLGCGVGEYYAHGAYTNYTGYDINHAGEGLSFAFFQRDYRGLEYLPTFYDTFVSLFSMEACLHPSVSNDFYCKWFKNSPNLQHALVSGFYYRNRKDELKIEEIYGLTSYQSILTIGTFPANFDEIRMEIEVPSKLFGPDVVEVWRILSRREPCIP